MPQRKRFIVYSVLLIPVILYISILLAWEYNGEYPTLGDEKNYVMVSKSITMDGDLSLTNNLNPDRVWFELPDGPVYDIHLFGLPLIITPGFLMADKAGVRFQLAAMAGLFPFITFFFHRKILGRWFWSMVLSFLFAISLPLVVVASKIFPDLLIGLGVLFCLERLFYIQSANKVTWSNLTIYSAVAGYITLLHVKSVLPAVILNCLLSYEVIRNEKNRLLKMSLLWGVLTGFLGIISWFHLHAYDNLLGIKGSQKLSNSLDTVFMVFNGLHWDRVHGMFVQNPLLLIGVIGLPLLLRNRPKFGLGWLLLYGSLIVPHCLHWNFYGGGLFGRFQWSSFALWTIPLGFAGRRLIKNYKKVFLSFLGFVFIYEMGFLSHSLVHSELLKAEHLEIFGSYETFLPYFQKGSEYLTHPQNYLAWLITLLLLAGGYSIRVNHD